MTPTSSHVLAKLNYGVDFPLFSKIDVNGDNDTSALCVSQERKGGGLLGDSIKWKFHQVSGGQEMAR